MSASEYKPLKMKEPEHASANGLIKEGEKLIGEEDADTLPDAGVLAIVKMCREAEDAKYSGDPYSGYITEMLVYFKTALKMMHEDPDARREYGQSVRGARKLISILQADYADEQRKEIVRPFLGDIKAVKEGAANTAAGKKAIHRAAAVATAPSLAARAASAVGLGGSRT